MLRFKIQLLKRMNRSTHPCGCVALVVLALGLALFPLLGHAQPIGTVLGFKIPEYYPPPHDTQMKSMLEGARAERQPDGRYLVTEAKWRTFRVTGEGELAVAAPQCFYDQSQRTVSSAGPLHVQTGDGKFSIEGEGFLYRQTNSTLVVSNRVHTILHGELLGPQPASTRTNTPAEEAPGIHLFSDQFDYAEESGLGVYQGNVRVAGTNLASTSDRLTIMMPVAERRLQSLMAETNVVIDYETIHATGEQAFYSADTGLIRLSGQPRPTWRIEEKAGSGDELVFDRTNRVFTASGHARLKMPAQSMGAAGFLAQPAAASAASPAPTNQFVDIQCDNYVLRTNLAVFRDQVRVSERLGDQLQGEMTCRLMTLTFTGTNEFQKMVAEDQVVITREDKQFEAARAEYTGANNLLDLTGNPGWRAGSRKGKGDWVRVNLAREEMLVRGNAFIEMPASELGQSALSEMGTSKQGESKRENTALARIFSEEYLLVPEQALFRGGVRIEHPQMKWTCEELTLLSPPELGKTGRMLIAEPAVVFDLLDDQGRTFHGTGQRAVCTRRVTATLTNDLMVLTGQPAMVQATNVVGRNSIITLDLTSHKLMAPGKYSLRGTLPPAGTNTFGPPKKRTSKII
jgi:lipopolysaccharide export system protein LptA